MPLNLNTMQLTSVFNVSLGLQGIISCEQQQQDQKDAADGQAATVFPHVFVENCDSVQDQLRANGTIHHVTPLARLRDGARVVSNAPYTPRLR